MGTRSCHRSSAGSPARHPLLRLQSLGPLLLGLLAACSAGLHPGSSGSQRHLFGAWQPVQGEQAGIRFATASAPAIVAARQRLGHDGERITEAVLANDTLDYGANKILIVVRAESDDRPLAVDSELVSASFTPATVEHNFELLLKGARRTSEPTPRRNRYGPYAFVAAEYPGSSRCVYAWQHVEGAATGLGRTGGDATVQFRFCDPGRDPQQLIEVFDNLVLNL